MHNGYLLPRVKYLRVLAFQPYAVGSPSPPNRAPEVKVNNLQHSVFSLLVQPTDMLEPLDTESLAALLCDDDSDDDSHIGSAKSYLAKGDMAEGVFKLFEAFPLFQAQLYYDEGTYDDGITRKWHIGFKVRANTLIDACRATKRSW